MNLSVDLVYNAELKIKRVSGTYPQTDNCYECEVSYVKDPTRNFTAQFVPQPIYDAWKLLQSLTVADIRSSNIKLNRYGKLK